MKGHVEIAGGGVSGLACAMMLAGAGLDRSRARTLQGSS